VDGTVDFENDGRLAAKKVHHEVADRGLASKLEAELAPSQKSPEGSLGLGLFLAETASSMRYCPKTHDDPGRRAATNVACPTALGVEKEISLSRLAGEGRGEGTR